MKNIKKTLSTLVLTAAVIATAQTVKADPMITNGALPGFTNASIDTSQGGFVGATTNTTDGITTGNMYFNGDSWVTWDALNVYSNEVLNFNAVDGVNGITVLNTVSGDMASTFNGAVNSNQGIAHLIISNPNGMLFDGCKFTTAGDLSLNATPMYGEFEGDKLKLIDRRYTKSELDPLNLYKGGYNLVKVELKDSNFTVGGDFSIVAPNINIYRSTLGLNGGKGTLRLETADGSTFSGGWITGNDNNVGRDSDPRSLAGLKGINLRAIEVDGNVEIVAGSQGDIITMHDGGHITGDLSIDSNDCVAINMLSYMSAPLTVDGNVNIVANGEIASVNNTTVGGNLDVYNKSGIVEVKDVTVKNDMNLTADNQRPNKHDRKSEIWMDGHNEVGGNVFLNAVHNILIGNNRGEKSSLTAGGDVNAHAQDGHVMVTSDVTAGNNISLKSDNLNILTDGEAVLKAKTYDFYSNGYIGGLGIYRHGDERQDLRSVVENYTFVPSLNIYTENGLLNATETFDNLHNASALIVNGGTITNLVANYAKIDSLGDLKIEHANIGEDMRISAIDSNLDLSSDDIHAKVIYVGDKTDSLTIAEKARDFIVTFFNIHNGDRHGAGAVRADEVVTTELADAYNTPKEGLERAEDTTELRFVSAPVEPSVDPVNPPVNPVDPSTVDASDNVKTLNSMNNDMLSQATDAAPVNTPTAYAADLDEDDNTSAPIRQNVDGSVTIVKEMVAD